MSGDLLMEVIKVLRQLQSHLPGVQEQEFARLSKRGEVDIVIKTLPSDDLTSLPAVDIREFLDTPEYSGPTKKGIRFSWDKLAEVIALLETQAQRLATQIEAEPRLFAGTEPTWMEKLDATDASNAGGGDPILADLLPNGVKSFPSDFVGSENIVENTIDLPVEPIEVAQRADGRYVVRSDFGFCHIVRNAAEGNFILYAYLVGLRKVGVPQEMIVVFRAVKAYQNYLRELRHSLVQAYERKSGHRPIAEYRVKEIFRNLGLPWVE